MRQASEAPSQYFVSGTVKEVKMGQKETEVTIRLTLAGKTHLKKGDNVSLRINS
jgi:hypothetical protein